MARNHISWSWKEILLPVNSSNDKWKLHTPLERDEILVSFAAPVVNAGIGQRYMWLFLK